MPLLDHFHEPLPPGSAWESFNVVWAVAMLEWLNRLLPRRYFALVTTHLGSQVEVDVAEFERDPPPDQEQTNGPGGGGVRLQTYAPPAVAMTLPAVYPDETKVWILDQRDGAR